MNSSATANPLQVGSWIQHWASGNLVGPSQYLEDRDIYETRSWAAHYALINNLRQIQEPTCKGFDSAVIPLSNACENRYSAGTVLGWVGETFSSSKFLVHDENIPVNAVILNRNMN